MTIKELQQTNKELASKIEVLVRDYERKTGLLPIILINKVVSTEKWGDESIEVLQSVSIKSEI